MLSGLPPEAVAVAVFMTTAYFRGIAAQQRIQNIGLTSEDVQRELRDSYNRMQMSLEPVRQHVAAIDKQIVALLAYSIPQPFIVHASSAG